MIALPSQTYLEAASAALTPQRPLLESIHDINVRFLCALREADSGDAYRTKPDLGIVTNSFGSLGQDAIKCAARFPFLLMDLRMSEADSLTTFRTRRNMVGEASAHILPADHLAIARSALVIGWHFARTDVGAALLLFGFSPTIALELAALPLHEIEAMAPYCVSPLALRWRTNLGLWRELLDPDAFGSVDSVRGFVMHAVQLTAATHLK